MEFTKSSTPCDGTWCSKKHFRLNHKLQLPTVKTTLPYSSQGIDPEKMDSKIGIFSVHQICNENIIF